MDVFLRNAGTMDAGAASRHTMDRIRRVFVECLHLNLSPDELDYERRLDESVGLDSIAALEFIAALEKEFGVVIEEEMLELDALRELPQLAAYIEARVAQPAARTKRDAGGAS